MGRLRNLKDAINGVVPKWSNVRTNIRGLPLYADPILKGTTRFSRKTGQIGLVNPDVQVNLATAVQSNADVIEVDRINDWFVVEGVVAIGGVERFAMTSVSETTISLNDFIKIPQEVGASVTLYSVPIISVGDFSKESTTIQIRSKHKLIIGDSLAFELQKNIFREINVKDVRELSPTVNEFPLTYEIDLEKGIPFDIVVDQKLQIRAYPAYFSKVLRVPKNPVSVRNLGPFLIDFYGGRIQNGITPEVFMTVQEYDLFNDKIKTVDPVQILQNHPITNRSFPFDIILFWDLMVGNFKLTKNTSVAVCDSEGKFGVTKDLQPVFQPGDSWKVKVNSNNDAIVRVGFEPNDFVTYNVPANTDTTIDIGTNTANQVIEKITIVASSNPGAEIEFGEWLYQGEETERIEIGIMSRVSKEGLWLGSGAIVKPFFLTLDYILANYDEEQNYDGGLIYF